MTRPYHLKRHGMGQVYGEEHPAAKLNEETVYLARHYHGLGLPIAAMASAFEMSQAGMSYAVTGVTWTYVPFPPDESLLP